MQWPIVILLTAVAFVGVVAQTTGQVVEILVGAGCKFSNYTALPKATATEPSYSLQLDPGLGKGIYVVHFTQFNLPEADVLIIRGSDATSPPVAALSGMNATGKFYSSGIAGSGITLELFKASAPDKANSTSCRGFAVSELLFSPKELVEEAKHLQDAVKVPLISTANATDSDDDFNRESLCGTDESVEAACAPSSTNSEEGAVMLLKSQPVARLSIIKENGMEIAYCTGWLVGCEGHLITNQHCIGNNQDALNTKVEFFAESESCGGSETCDSRGGCPGSAGVAGTTLVAVSEDLDYALVRLGANMSLTNFSGLYEKTGYLQFRGSGAVLNEDIYIPQHPLGYGKRIAWLYNGQSGRVESLTVTECRDDDVGYYVDTQEGSSGSPIIGTSDNNVIALHHCGGCLNGGIPAKSIIEDLTKKGVLPKCTVAGAGESNTTKTL
ncbi:Peptidase S1, PA clan [Phytophthora cactorum]|nr:Peptidase S1, PA clan [Phytophthora cactorum]